MTQTLIEQLEKLQKYAPNIGGDMIYSGQPPETLKWINADDLRAIIEQYKRESGKSIGYIVLTEGNEMRLNFYPKAIKEGLVGIGDKLYTSPQTSNTKLIRELVEALEKAIEATGYMDWTESHKERKSFAEEALKRAREAIKYE